MVSQQAESAKSAETLTAVRGLITSPSAPTMRLNAPMPM